MAQAHDLILTVKITGGISSFQVYLEGLEIKTFYYDTAAGLWRSVINGFGIEGQLNISFISQGWKGASCTLDIAVGNRKGLSAPVTNEHGPLTVLTKSDIDLSDDGTFA